jgi:hypothetical protein
VVCGVGLDGLPGWLLDWLLVIGGLP